MDRVDVVDLVRRTLVKDPIGVRLYNGPERRRSIESPPPSKWRLDKTISVAELLKLCAYVIVGIGSAFVFAAHWVDQQMQRIDMLEHQLIEQDTRYTKILNDMNTRLEEIRLDVKAMNRKR